MAGDSSPGRAGRADRRPPFGGRPCHGGRRCRGGPPRRASRLRPVAAVRGRLAVPVAARPVLASPGGPARPVRAGGLRRRSSWPAAGWPRSPRFRVVAGGVQEQVGELVQDRPVDLPGHDRGEHRVTGGGLGVRAGQEHRPGIGGGGGAGQAPARLRPGRPVAQPASRPGPPGRPRSAARSIWTWTWARAGCCPSWPGSRPAAVSRSHACCSASCRRCAAVRVSSGPPRWDSASRITARLAAHSGVRSPCSRPAPPRVVSSHTARSANPPSSVSGVVRARSIISRASTVRSCRSAPPGRGREQDLIRIRPQVLGQLPGPVADLPRPRRRDLPGRQRGRDDGVGGQPPRPPEGAARRPRGDLRERPQPGPGAVVPVGLIAVLGT